MSSLAKRCKDGLTGIVLGASIALSSCSYPQPAYAKPATYTQKTAPHYLQGIRRPSDPLENMLEKDRVYRSLLHKYPHKPRTIAINGSIEHKVKVHGKDTTLVFPNYVRQKDGGVRHYHAAGMDDYSGNDFNRIVQDQVQYIRNAARLAMRDYRKTLKVILKSQEAALKKAGKLKPSESLKDRLDDPVRGYPGLKIRDILFTPDVSIKDFVPKRYYFGEIAALGVTYISAGVIGMDPKGRVLDYINGWPAILVHEMTHHNPKLQGYPMIGKFDPELWASFPMLAHDSMDRLLFHGYLKDARKVSKILFNFDSKLAYEDMLGLKTLMGIEYEKADDHRKLRDYMKKVRTISKEIRDTAFSKYIPEFYTHPLYYMTLNSFLKDDNATFKLMMYMNYEPTLLGGPEKTRLFIQQNAETMERAGRKVLNKFRNERERSRDETRRIEAELKSRLESMPRQQKQALMEAARMFGLKSTKADDMIEFGLKMHRLGIVEVGR